MLSRLRSEAPSARLFNGSSQYLSVTAAPITDEPLTMACWFYSTSSSATQGLVGLGNNGTYGFWMLSARGDIAGDPIRASKQADAGGSAGLADATTGYTTNTWHHAAATFTSNTSRAAYLNGGAKGTNTTSIVDPTPDFVSIGALRRSGVDYYHVGRIAHAAIWNAALTDEEICALGIYRWCPLLIRPQSLVAYYPLSHAFDGDLARGYHLTPTDAPTWTAGPRGIVYPRPTWQPAMAAAVAGVTSRGVIIGGGLAV